MKNTQIISITALCKRAIAALCVLATFIVASMLNQAYAAVILSEDFESENIHAAYSAVNAGSFDGPRTARDWHWERHSNNTTNNTSFYRGFQGQDYWAGINLDENGSSASSPSKLTLGSVDISQYENTSLSISVASSGGLEGSDFLAIYAQERSIDSVSGLPQNSHQRVLIDSFFGGKSDKKTIELSADFQTVNYDLSKLAYDFFSLHFEAFTNASKESVAFDDIVISGDFITDSNKPEDKITTASSPKALSAMGLIALAFMFKRRSQ